MTENNMRQHLWDLCGLEDGELDCHKHHLKVTVETIYDDRAIRLTTSPVDMAIFLADYKLVKRLCEKDFKVSFLEEGDIYLDIDLDQIEKKTDSNDWNRTPITLGNILLMHAYEMPVECLHALQEASERQTIKSGPAISFGKDFFDNPLFRMQNDVAATQSLYVLYKECPDLIKDMMLVAPLGSISYPVGAGEFEKKNYKMLRRTLYEILKDSDKELALLPSIFLTPNVEFYSEFLITKKLIKNCMEDAAYCIKALLSEQSFYKKNDELKCAYCLGLFMAISGLIDYYQDETKDLSLRKYAFEITMPVVQFVQEQYKAEKEIFNLLFGILNLPFSEYGMNEKETDGTIKIDVNRMNRMLWIFHYIFRLPIKLDLKDGRTMKLIRLFKESSYELWVDFLELVDAFTLEWNPYNARGVSGVDDTTQKEDLLGIVDVLDYILRQDNEELLYLALKKGLIPLALVEECIARYQTQCIERNETKRKEHSLLPVLLAYRAKLICG